MIGKLFRYFNLVWTLAKRDYIVQYAGAGLGLSWLFLQSFSLVGLYLLVFFVIDFPGLKSKSNHYVMILSGILFWTPIQELILKSAGILVENRSIIKKSLVGSDPFLKIPMIQYVLHFIIIYVPCSFAIYILGNLNIFLFLFCLIAILIFGVLLFPILSYLAYSNVLLKDISPLLRLILQFGFWSLPILYYPSGKWLEILSWNPLFFMLELFRFFLIQDYSPKLNWVGFGLFCLTSLGFYLYSNKRIKQIIMDQL